jgi:ferredoxin
MVKINEDTCIGCGLCEAICGEVFEVNSKGKAAIKKNAKDAPCIKEAIDSCPVNSISK